MATILKRTITLKLAQQGMASGLARANTYLYTFQVFTADAQGKYNGKRIIHATVHMDGPDHYKGHGSADVIDLAGNVMKNVFAADVEGIRMQVELA